MTKVSLPVLALVTLLTLTLVLQPGSAQQKQTLVIAHNADALTLDPHTTAVRETRIITHQIFDFLLTSTGGQAEPGLATRWESSSDGKTWTFTLRSDARFQDGTPVDAAAVKYNFERIVRLGSKAIVLASLVAAFDRAEVLSSTQVRVFLKQPYGAFLNAVGGEYFGMVSPTAAEKLGDDFARAPAGSGPFIFRNWVPKERVVLQRNPAYRWGPSFLGNAGPAKFDEVVYRVLPESASLTQAFENGEVQLLDLIVPTDVARMKSRGVNFETVVQITPGVVSSYVFNLQTTPTDDLRVRKAVAHAINKKEIQQSPAWGNGLVPAVYSYLSKTNWAHNPELEASKTYDYDFDQARRLLDEAGWRAGPDGARVKDGKVLTLVILSFKDLPINAATDVIVQSQLAKVGIKTEIQSVDLASLYAALERGQFNMSLGSLGGFDPDSPLRRGFHSKGGSNFGHYRNADVDRLIERGAEEMVPAQRRAVYRQVQEALFKDLPSVPMLPFIGIIAKQPNLSGVWFDPRSGFKLVNAERRQ